MLLAHHEWAVALLWAILGGGATVGYMWVKAKLTGHRHQHKHSDGTEHTHSHQHGHDDHGHGGKSRDP